jgi:hypothetical protein
MPKPKADTKQQDQAQSLETGASPGPDPVVETPKDVGPEYVTERDKVQRKIDLNDVEKTEEALLDDAVELTFPASDPIAVPTHEELEALKKRKNRGAEKTN